MEFYLLLLLLPLPIIFGNVCIPYNFEERFEEFDPTLGPICENYNSNWDIQDYSSSNISVEPPHELSKTFITSIAPASCVSSFFFDVEDGGVVEVNVYVLFSEILMIIVHNEEHQQIDSWTSIFNPIPPNQWTPVSFTVTTIVPVRGYLSIFATVSVNETIIIDSFRYIPPNSNADDIECAIYRDDNDTDGTSEAPTTENEGTTEADGLTEAPTPENGGTTDAPTTENGGTTETDTENGGTTEDGYLTDAPTTENGGTTETDTENGGTTEADGLTEAPTTENWGTTDALTTENWGTTDTPSTENEVTTEDDTENGSTTEADGLTEAPTPENGGTTDVPTTENGGTTETDTENGGTTDLPSTENGGTDYFTTETPTSYPGEITTDSNDLDTTTNSYTDIDNTESNSGEDTTDNPDMEEVESSFWNPFTIALVATGCFLFLVLICYISYKCGKRKEKKKIPDILFLDIEELPKTIVVPRVKKVYTDSINNSNLYAKDYF